MTIDSMVKNAVKKPMVLLRLNADENESLQNTRNGMTEFTLARQHPVLEGIKVPCIVLIFVEGENGESEGFIGAITTRAAITTLDTRITVKRVGRIDVNSEDILADNIKSNQLRGIFERKKQSVSTVVLLSPVLSVEILVFLSKSDSNIKALLALSSLFGDTLHKVGNLRLQDDAVRSALKIFGLNTDTVAEALVLKNEKETSLKGVRIREDAVIEHDARVVPGFTITDSCVTGRAYFKNGGDHLEIITANKRPLEEVLGVDLIYINRTLSNVVLVQYKMLEQEGSGDKTRWVYRPDTQLEKELNRMRKFVIDDSDQVSSYRLNSQAFYMKLVKRDSGQLTASATIPLDHFEGLLVSPEHQGARGAVCLDYKALSGRYLRNQTFIDLVSSGYIGTQDAELESWEALIDSVIDGDRAVIAAIQSSSGSDYERDAGLVPVI